MSVINDMLRDLDRRDGQRPPLTAGTISVVVPAREWPWRAPLLLAIGVALVAGSYSVLAPRLQRQPVMAPAAEKTAEAPEKPGANNSEQKPGPVTAQSRPVAAKPADAATEAETEATTAPMLTSKQSRADSKAVPNVAAVGHRDDIQPAPAVQQETAEPVSQPLQKQLSQSPEALADDAYRRGALALRDGQRTDAAREFNNALKLVPNHSSALDALARLHFDEARFDAVEALLPPALLAGADLPELRLLLARAQLQQGRAAQALQTLRERQPALSAHRDYYATLAALAQQLGDHRAAAEQYTALLGVDPTQAAWWLGLALARENLQAPREALDAYRRALTLNSLPVAARDFAQQRVLALE